MDHPGRLASELELPPVDFLELELAWWKPGFSRSGLKAIGLLTTSYLCNFKPWSLTPGYAGIQNDKFGYKTMTILGQGVVSLSHAA